MKEKDSRALAHIELVHDIRPIEGADNIELIHCLGWTLIAKKQEFQEGQKAVYIEIDSKVPETEPFAFLASKGYKIKTMKLSKFNVISQGIALPLSLLGLDENKYNVGDDVTKVLGIKKIETNEEKRLHKSEGVSKQSILTSIKARHRKFFQNKFVKKLIKHKWFQDFIISLLARKGDKPRAFPAYITKTDETRIENMPWILGDGTRYIKTEKIDGTSSTYAVRRIKKNKFELIVCSRNVRQADRDQANFNTEDAGGNIYWEMADKYHIHDALIKIANEYNQEVVILQGESIGNVQGNPYKLKDNQFYGYNLVFTDHVKSFYKKFNPIEAKEIVAKYKIDWVPILDTDFYTPATIEEMKQLADGQSVINPKVIREGIVCRSYGDGNDYISFKNVSNTYLLKHNG